MMLHRLLLRVSATTRQQQQGSRIVVVVAGKRNNMSSLSAISAIDGRYHKSTEGLKEYFSEYALIKQRVIVEIKWLQFVTNELNIAGIPKISNDANGFLDGMITKFSMEDAKRVKEIEK